MRRPGWFQSLRFRMALAFGSAVFFVGSILIAGLYVYQVRQLEDPVLTGEVFVLRDETVFRTTLEERLRFELESLEQRSYRIALEQARQGSIYAVGALAVFSFLAGWFLSGLALRPVGRIRRTAAEISARDLSQRIAMDGPDDEFKELADTFDSMLDRLEHSFDSQRRLVHDSSHELRNPLAVARTNLELGLTEPDTAEGVAALRHRARLAVAALGRMGVLVDGLLDQARASGDELQPAPVALHESVARWAEEFRAVAAARGLTVEAESPELVVDADESLLTQAVANLLANATRLAPEGSTVRLSARPIPGGGAEIVVADEGPGIPAADVGHVFDRFWRGEGSSGSGLGLSIVREVAERHGGSASVESEPGGGSTFSIVLPEARRSSRG